MVLIKNRFPGGGASDLAVRILGGTVQPAGSAGMLWVNTDVAIDGWAFAAVAPGSPAAGMVWIQTDAANANAINILKNNAAVENVKSVYQYTSGAWARLEAYYHNGTGWAQVSYVVINPNTDLSYTGSWSIIDDGDGHWRVKFTTSGTLTVTGGGAIDLFLLGGGGGTPKGVSGGGGGGYTATHGNLSLSAGTYAIVVGSGGVGINVDGAGNQGGTTSALGFSAAGGYGGVSNAKGGNGGSGGGGAYNNGGSPNTCGGGSDGSNGTAGGDTTTRVGGTGQGSTTREFGEATGTLYAGGGASYGGAAGAGGGAAFSTAAVANTGGGAGSGGGTLTGYAGGSGIVVMRDHRAA